MEEHPEVRWMGPDDIDDISQHLKNLLAAGIFKESRSPYASPIVIVHKKNGKVRMCFDSRTLNNKTIPDQYTTPRNNDALDWQWFSVLDLWSGYYQIPMAKSDRQNCLYMLSGILPVSADATGHPWSSGNLSTTNEESCR